MNKALKIFCGAKNKKAVLLLFTACLAIFACSNESYFLLGSNLIEPKFKVVYIDTCSVKLSTMRIDSTPTYNQATILAGRYKDVNTVSGDLLTGTTTAMSFMEIARPSFSEMNTNTFFDSIVLEMRFNGFYMGDTVSDKMHLMVYRLSERISKEDEYSQSFYNHAKVETESLPLVESRFSITPSNKQAGIMMPGNSEVPPVRIKLPDDLGQDLFDKIKEGAPEVENSTNFLNYFKGLAFKPGDDVNTIVGFKADTTFKIILHYHQREDFDTKREIVFGINQSKQFNNVVSDRTGTSLDSFTPEDKEINAALTHNQAYLMGGDGLYAKIEFPYLSNILQLSDYGAVERAVMEIKPVMGTFQKFTELPSTINVYATTQYGESASQLVDSQNAALTGNLVVDNQFWSNTAYTYDISGFIQNQINAAQSDKMYISVRLPDNDMQQTTKRLVIGNSDHQAGRITLKLYYSMYNN